MIDMPIVIPSNVMENIGGWSTELKIPDLSHVITVLKETWDLQTFNNLQQGKVAVADDVINESLQAAIEGSESIKELSITSLEDHKLKISALTKQAGHIVFICKVEQFIHSKDLSMIKLKIIDKKLPDKPIVSWIFSKVSMAMVTKLVGRVEPDHGLAVQIHGNEVTIDFHQALYESKMGSAELFGYKPMDALIINEAVPQKGFVQFTTAMDLPANIKMMIENVLI